jgi:hypothetical protein
LIVEIRVKFYLPGLLRLDHDMRGKSPVALQWDDIALGKTHLLCVFDDDASLTAFLTKLQSEYQGQWIEASIASAAKPGPALRQLLTGG